MVYQSWTARFGGFLAPDFTLWLTERCRETLWYKALGEPPNKLVVTTYF